MKRIILFLIVAVKLSGSPRELHYKVEQINSNTVEVTLNFNPKKGGENLYIPDSAKLLSHKKGGKSLRVEGIDAEVKYLVKSRGKWKFSSGYVPRIEKDFFHLEGENLFVRPMGKGTEEVKMHIEWDGDKKIASSFGTGKNPQDFTANYLDLKRSIFLGGRYLTVEKEKVRGSEVNFVFLTKKKNKRERKNKMMKIIEKQKSIYQSKNSSPYLVAVLDDPIYGGGRSFVNACCIYLPGINRGMDMDWVFAHEHFHAFNGIGTHGQYAKEDLQWFTEGFTEFYANRTNAGAGIYNQKTYKANVIRTINEYKNSKVKKLSYNQILKNKKKDFFSNRYLYVKGHLFAHFLDLKIQKKSNGNLCLDDFMKQVYTTHQSDNNGLSFAKLSCVYANFDDTSLEDHFNKFMLSEELLIDEREILT